MDSIGIEATSATSGDVHNLSLPTGVGLLLLVLILGIISSRRLRGRGLGVNHLFLKILFRRNDQSQTGFVRTLDVDEMRLVMAEAPLKGEKLTFDLSSLPGFPSADKSVNGVVTRVKSIGGNSHNFLVSVTLDVPGAARDVSDNLVSYLRQLHA